MVVAATHFLESGPMFIVPSRPEWVGQIYVLCVRGSPGHRADFSASNGSSALCEPLAGDVA